MIDNLKVLQTDLANIRVSTMPNKPTVAGWRAEQIKDRFDAVPAVFLALNRYNGLIDALMYGAGIGRDTGARSVGATTGSGFESNVQDVLDSLFNSIKQCVPLLITGANGTSNMVGTDGMREMRWTSTDAMVAVKAGVDGEKAYLRMETPDGYKMLLVNEDGIFTDGGTGALKQVTDEPYILTFPKMSGFPVQGKANTLYIEQEYSVMYYWAGGYFPVMSMRPVTWGDIMGTIADQADLAELLAVKVDTVNGKPGGDVVLAAGDIKTAAGQTLEQKFATISDEIQAMNGVVTYLEPHDFGNPASYTNPTWQQTLTTYACQQLGVTKLPNSVDIVNAWNGHEWIYNRLTEIWIDFGQASLVIDQTPVSGSANAVASGGVFTALQNKIDTAARNAANGVAGLDASGKVAASAVPTLPYIGEAQKGAASGVASLDSAGHVPVAQVPVTGTISAGNTAPVTSGGVYAALQGKLNTAEKGAPDGVAPLNTDGKVPAGNLVVDPAPVMGSANPVSSGGVYNALGAAPQYIQAADEAEAQALSSADPSNVYYWSE